MRVGVMVGSRFGRVAPERVVRGGAGATDVAKEKLEKAVKKRASPKRKGRVKKDV